MNNDSASPQGRDTGEQDACEHEWVIKPPEIIRRGLFVTPTVQEICKKCGLTYDEYVRHQNDEASQP